MEIRLRSIAVAISAALCLAALSASYASAEGPSFDCAKAHSIVERLICNSPQLSELDSELATTYSNSINTSGADIFELKDAQTKWLKSRDGSCPVHKNVGTADKGESAESCLATLYRSRITELRDPEAKKRDAEDAAIRMEMPDYGIYVYRFDKDHKGLEGRGTAADPYIAKLFDLLAHEKGPVKDKLDQVSPPDCDTNPACGKLTKPPTNTVVLAHYRAGVGNSGQLFRSILTFTDGGSGAFTRPVLAMDFEVTWETHFSDDGKESSSSVTVSLTGMEDYSDERLSHVEGLPKPSGCFGCP